MKVHKSKILAGLLILILLGTTLFNMTTYFHIKQTQSQLNQTIPTQNTVPNMKPANLETLQNSIIHTIEKASAAVVNIVISKNIQLYLQDPFDFWSRKKVIEKTTQIGGGSGILISKNGLVITNKHVVEDIRADYSVVLNDGSVYKVQHIRFDPAIDVAILQIIDEEGNTPTNLATAAFSDFTTEVKIWQFAIAIGNALAEYKNSVSRGIISATNRQLVTENNNLYIGLYQTDTPINPGNSGGPLLDIYGNVIGITTAVSSIGDDIGFALPTNQQFIDATVQSIKTFGKILRPFMGIEYEDLTKPLAEEIGIETNHWAFIQNVIIGTPAHTAGLEPQDVIIAVNGNPITKQVPFLYHIYQFLPGQEVTFTIIREGKQKTISVILGQK